MSVELWNSIDEARTVLDRLPLFEQSNFTAFAYPSRGANGEDGHAITRSVHCDIQDWHGFVELKGPIRSSQARRVARKLMSGGYKRKARFAGEEYYIRWLADQRELEAELAFLAQFGPDGAGRVRRRRPTRKPQLATHLTPLAWQKAMLAVRQSEIQWNDLAITHSIMMSLTERSQSWPISIEISAHVANAVNEKPFVESHVRVYDRAAKGGRVPLRVYQKAGRVLGRFKYEQHSADGDISASKRHKSLVPATRECIAIYEHLVELLG